MKFLRNFLILSIAFLGLTLTNVNAQNYSNARNDSAVERQIFKRILNLTYYGVFDNIGYQLDGDTVTLTGKVRNAFLRKDAERTVKKIDGVQMVVNNIDVLPLSGFDDSIRLRALRTLQNGGALYRYVSGVNPAVKIIVENGRLTLEGYVANRGDYNLMNVLANGVSGVFRVQNNLIVEKDSAR